VTRPDLAIISQRIVTPDGMRSGAVLIRGEQIVGIVGADALPVDCEIDDVTDAVVLPGLVDSHVHVNEPGRTEWEGFACATRAAAAGGVTTIVDMPLNSIPATTTTSALETKVRAAERQCFVDVGFWGGLVPGNESQLAPLHEAGVLGFKCFLVPSGVDEFGWVTEADLRRALPTLARVRAVLLVHAELPGPLAAAAERLRADSRFSGAHEDPRAYTTYLATRPAAAEDAAIDLLVRLCRECGVRTHVVHLASANAVRLVAAAQADGLPFTAETCPHYLRFSADQIPDGATAFKCAPPIRERGNTEGLWTALATNVIESIVSDHSPASPELKNIDSGNFLTAWGGIASLQLGLSIVWTEARERGFSLEKVATWMSTAPAHLAGLARKGAIAVGRDADLAIFDPEAEFVVDPNRLFHRHRVTPYLNQRLRGVVRRTYLRGRRVYEERQSFGPPSGTLLLRSRPG
jgi:allantoinase